MTSFEKVLKEKGFIITTELDPVKGIDVSGLEEKITLVEDYVDAINLTDSSMARMKISPIAVSSYLQNKYQVDWICHLTTRDRNIIGLQSDILGAVLMGVCNFLFLTGDRPDYGDHPMSTGVFDCDGTGLIKIAASLKRGFDLAGNSLNRAADQLVIGGSINPGGQLEKELEKFEERVASGVDFFQTQPVYDLKLVEQFISGVEEVLKRQKNKPRFLISVMPLKSGKMARYLNNNVPGIDIPEKIVEFVEKGGIEAGLQVASSFINEVKEIVDGVHIMPMGRAESVVYLIEKLK